ncbi:hypothetical protein DMB90_01965 [Raoultella planticola]|uniref:Uncharacterized protein n=1 Tax=Raoultella planticola TaxID=575 RepID=A0A5P6A923_RAOPL|nr:hypothetical protein DMB90_01965 [Raoultella planticola]
MAGASGTPEPALRRFELALLGHWAMALISSTAPAAGEAVDDTMTYRYREEKGLLPAWLLITTPLPGTI